MNLLRKLFLVIQKASPQLRKRLVRMFVFLFFLNCAVWIWTIVIMRSYPVMLGLIAIAYGLGLRHAVDADHIAAIDNTTRKLMHEGKRPVGVGFFFSLGHSTIVILLSTIIALSASFVKNVFPTFKETGALIGASMAGVFLILIGIVNLVFLIGTFRMWTDVTKKRHVLDHQSVDKHLSKRGVMTRILSPFLKTVTESWHMYIVGFLFGLGFDTASEVGFLSISASIGTANIPIAYILTLPLAFTAGMTLIDTFDGILMLGAYGWAYINPVRKLYYNLNITFISVIIALFIGGIQLLQLLALELQLKGSFFHAIQTIDFANLGYFIIITCIISWAISAVIYKLKGFDKLDIDHKIAIKP